METLYTWVRGLHIAGGLLALASFAVPLVTRKGGAVHRKVGWAYVIAMYVAAASGATMVFLSMAMDRVRPGLIFLAYVAWVAFTSAFYGVRVLKQKGRSAPHRDVVDLGVPVLLLVFTVALIVYSVSVGFSLGLYFSPIGFVTAGTQLKAMLRPPERKSFWWTEHMGGMLPACIATLTAFAVTNVPSGAGSWALAAWLGPTVIGVPGLLVWTGFYRRRLA